MVTVDQQALEFRVTNVTGRAVREFLCRVGQFLPHGDRFRRREAGQFADHLAQVLETGARGGDDLAHRHAQQFA